MIRREYSRAQRTESRVAKRRGNGDTLGMVRTLALPRVRAHDPPSSLKAARAVMENRLKGESGALPASRPARARKPLHRLGKTPSLRPNRVKRISCRKRSGKSHRSDGEGN